MGNREWGQEWGSLVSKTGLKALPKRVKSGCMQNQKYPNQGRPKTIVASSSLFSQLLSLFDRKHFSQMVHETGSEKRSKGFASWDRLELGATPLVENFVARGWNPLFFKPFTTPPTESPQSGRGRRGLPYRRRFARWGPISPARRGRA